MRFKEAIRKLEGKKDAVVSTSKEAWGGESTGYGCLLKLLRGEWGTPEYVQGIRCIPREERLAAFSARRHIGFDLPLGGQVGLHHADERTIAAAIEYFESHPVRQQQASLQNVPSGGTTNNRSSDSDRTPTSYRFIPMGVASVDPQSG